ncbi:MAG: tRNA lysidine(34) synthetase TilS, partial [Alphaproteobacteria bacterium]
HRTLRWQGAKPRTGVQAAARSARYALLFDWCRKQGVLHLVLGHHADDQAETFLLRLSRGSGPDGLAAMAAVVEGPELRLLRPLLAVSKARLVATLRARRQDWIEDPSNVDLAHARVRVRALLPGLSDQGMGPRRLAAAAAFFGHSRIALEAACARLLAEAATPLPEGYLWLDPAPLARADGAIRRRALLQCLLAVSGAVYPPRLERLERLADELGRGLAAGRTLCGCRLAPQGGRILICREVRGTALPVPVAPGQRLAWDGRFDIRLKPRPARIKGAARVRRAAGAIACLGAEGWKKIVGLAPELRSCGLPSLVRPTLPALWVGDRVAEVPHLGYRAESAREPGIESVVWSPPHPLMGAGFSVAEMGSNII